MDPSPTARTMEGIDLRELRHFVAVAESGSFTLGAREVRLTQPALSQSIRLLEQRLGCPLFERLDRRITLTPPGEEFLRHARAILAAVNDAGAAMDEFLGAARGRLRIGTVQTVNVCWLPRVLAKLLPSHPGASVSVAELAAPSIEERLVQGSLDIGISFLPATLEGVEGERLRDEELVLIARGGDPILASPSVGAKQAAAARLVLLGEEFCTRRLAVAAFAREGLTLAPALEMNSIEGILTVIRESGGATILPEMALRMHAGAGLVGRTIRGIRPRRTLGLLWRRGAYRSPLARALSEAFRRTAP